MISINMRTDDKKSFLKFGKKIELCLIIFFEKLIIFFPNIFFLYIYILYFFPDCEIYSQSDRFFKSKKSKDFLETRKV